MKLDPSGELLNSFTVEQYESAQFLPLSEPSVVFITLPEVTIVGSSGIRRNRRQERRKISAVSIGLSSS